MFLQTANYFLFLAVASGAMLISVLAVANCAMAPASGFVVSGKRTKGFWLMLTIGSFLVSALGIVSAIAGNFGLGLFQIIAASIAGVYLADVKPEVTGRRQSGW